MQLGLEQLLVGISLGLVLGDERGRERAAQAYSTTSLVLAGAEQHADGGVLVGLAHVAVERLQVEAELAEVLGLEAADLQLDGDEAVEAAVEERAGRARSPGRRPARDTREPTKQKSRPSSMRKSLSLREQPGCRSASAWLGRAGPRNSSM